jgi:hypothetical protein
VNFIRGAKDQVFERVRQWQEYHGRRVRWMIYVPAIHDFIARDPARAAAALVERLLTATERLA